MVIAATHLRTIIDHDGAVVLDINRDQFFSMNAVGTFIWTRLLDDEDLERIAEALALETGMDLSVVSADVNDFIADLKSKCLFPKGT
jgi:Coenzyme PQQ synthesis protein D (PqqD)